MRRFWKKPFRLNRAAVLGAILAAMLIFAGVWIMAMPGRSFQGALPPLTEEESRTRDRLRKHVATLATEIGERNVQFPDKLEAAADYIHQEFTALGLEVREQTFPAGSLTVRNLEADLPAGPQSGKELIVIGAHYDSAPGTPGANDNASGVAALLELARLLKDRPRACTVRLVAFVNEEAPHFGTERMGSLRHARAARERGDRIRGMISLETIGYYSDTPGSQQYPVGLGAIYPEAGNFIGLIGNIASGGWVRELLGAFRRHAAFPSEGLASPEGIPGVALSDHWAYWQEGYPALMLTDTAPFRYPHYHEASDTPDKIDYERTARVVAGLAGAVAEIAAL